MAYNYRPYQDSEDTKKKYQAYETHKATRPGEYTFGKQAELDSARDAWQNRDAFQYNAAEDGMYQQMVDRYIQQGKMAMQDAMGQASTMTGGYGNTWAQNAGQQAYQVYLNGINDMAPQYYQMAQDRYQMEGENLYNQYAALSAEEQMAYGRHMDAQNLWQAQNDALKAEADESRAFGWQQYATDIANQQWQANFDANAAAQARQEAESSAAVKASFGDFSGYQELHDLTDEQVKQLQEQWEASQGTTPTYYNFMRKDGDGNSVFQYGDKEYTYGNGVNPYTNDVNPDVANGVFANGYQPDNVNNNPLERTGITDVINGRSQPVYRTMDGQRWIWDETLNAYLKYGEEPSLIEQVWESVKSGVKNVPDTLGWLGGR